MNLNEIIEVSKWWRDLGIANSLMFAGYQPLKWYMWPMACFTDPCFSDQRFALTKPISQIYVIDDIFNVHGAKNPTNMAMFHNTLGDMFGKLPGNASNKIGGTMSRKITSDPYESISISNVVVGRTFVLSNSDIPAWAVTLFCSCCALRCRNSLFCSK